MREKEEERVESLTVNYKFLRFVRVTAFIFTCPFPLFSFRILLPSLEFLYTYLHLYILQGMNRVKLSISQWPFMFRDLTHVIGMSNAREEALVTDLV